MREKTIKTLMIATPLGPMLAGATESGLCFLEFLNDEEPETMIGKMAKAFRSRIAAGLNDHLVKVRRQLDEYFAGKRKTFDIDLDIQGTPFQMQAWQALAEIPYGSTISYGRQAAAMGRPTAVRAAANANGANRISIIIPCHRVIGSDGSLTGYGGGLWRKQFLLELESGKG